MPNSYITPEIERSNSYSSSLLHDLQTSNFSWLGDFNYLSGERNEDFPSFLYDNPSNESVTAGNSHDKEVIGKTQERNCSSDVKEKESRFNKSKRRKILDTEDGQGSQALATGQQIKAPVKRSQKLGDKVTALQQLVSPFGKTDTASVLQEASVYIKFLQEQIEVLSTPYFRYRTSMDPKAEKEDRINLRSRGLCLIPISSTVDLTKEAGNGHISTGKTSSSRR